MFRKDKKYIFQQGFNIIEILIMVSLLAITFVAIMTMVMKNIKLELITRNDFIAVNLANEGVELVEEIRNANLNQGPPLYYFYTDIACNNPPACDAPLQEGDTYHFIIDYVKGRDSIQYVPTESLSDPLTILQYNDNEFYQYTGTDPNNKLSDFHRLITTVFHNPGQTNQYIAVKSEVSWSYRGHDYVYTANTLLFDDKQQQ